MVFVGTRRALSVLSGQRRRCPYDLRIHKLNCIIASADEGKSFKGCYLNTLMPRPYNRKPTPVRSRGLDAMKRMSKKAHSYLDESGICRDKA